MKNIFKFEEEKINEICLTWFSLGIFLFFLSNFISYGIYYRKTVMLIG